MMLAGRGDPGGRSPCAQGSEQQLRREAGADALSRPQPELEQGLESELG
jgi:hypothetical protein